MNIHIDMENISSFKRRNEGEQRMTKYILSHNRKKQYMAINFIFGNDVLDEGTALH